MNWTRLQNLCRIAVQIVLVAILLSVTFLQLMKYREETTNISVSHDDYKGDLELPSMTFCPRYRGEDSIIQENRTFDDYMEGVRNVTDFFDYANQRVFLPGKK